MNKMMRNFVVCAAYALGAAFAGGGVLPQPVLAQEQMTLEEVLVTAQRREESLQEVPLAITVLSGEDLERRQVHNILDLQSSVPNISIAQNTGTPSAARIFLRGVGQDESRATVEPAIPLYIDGVYIGRQIGALVDLFDVERVEVLRGPQGTLYGRNANGGAVRIITRKPAYDETLLTLKTTLGSENRIDTQLSANLSDSPDLAVSFSLLTRTRDGLFRTTAVDGGIGEQEVGEWDNFSGRVGVRWQAGDATEMLLRYDLTADNTDPRPANSPFVDEDDIFDLQAAPGSPAGVNTDAYNSKVDSKGVSLTVDHDLGGGLNLQSLTAWRSLEDELVSFIVSNYSQETEQSQLSQELQVTSDWEGDFNFVAGVFWFDEDIDLDFTFFGANFALEVETRAWAVFGQGTWDLSDRLRLTAGVRYTDEEKDFKGAGIGGREQTQEWENTSYRFAVNYQLQDNMMLYGSYSTGFKSGAWSPDGFPPAIFLPVDEETVKTAEAGIRSDLLDNRLRLNATYFFSKYEDLQLGGTTDKGFTQFNVPEAEISGLEIEASATPAPGLNVSVALAWLDAEYSDVDFSSALGISGRNLGNEVAAVVDPEVLEEVDDQLSSGGGITEQDIVDQVYATDDEMNIDRSTMTLSWLTENHGAEVEAAKIAVGRVELTSLVTAAETRVTPGIRASILDDAENNDLKNAPESSIKLALSYTYPLAANMDLQLNAEYIYEDESFNLVANPEATKRDETDLINLRVGVRSERCELFLWGKNLTYEVY